MRKSDSGSGLPPRQDLGQAKRVEGYDEQFIRTGKNVENQRIAANRNLSYNPLASGLQ